MVRKARFLVAAFAAIPLLAPIETARMSGTVTDAADALVVSAKVTITNTDTGSVFETSTNRSGRYESLPLRIGRYRVSAEAAGFKRGTRGGIVLQVQQTAVVDFRIETGQVQQEIVITANAPLLATTEATQAQRINNKKSNCLSDVVRHGSLCGGRWGRSKARHLPDGEREQSTATRAAS